jgi:hypothetical protein
MNVLPHDQMTLSVVKKIAYEVSHASFPEAVQNLRHQFGMEVSVSECHRVAQQWGPRLDALQRKREADWLAPWSDNLRPAPAELSPKRVVLEADATSALTGRDEEHKMVYCATGFGLESRVTKGRERKMLVERRYSASGVDFDDFVERFRALAARLNAHASQAVAFVGDGAACLWRMAEEYLPKGTVMIQDYWHVAQHLENAARIVHGESEETSLSAERWKSQLWESRLEELLVDLRRRARALRGKHRRELESEIGYLESGRDRMDYARYRAEGWLVGSGAVEGTCKHLVKRRYNMTGARWKRANIPWVLALRLSIFNEEWEADWGKMREAA